MAFDTERAARRLINGGLEERFVLCILVGTVAMLTIVSLLD